MPNVFNNIDEKFNFSLAGMNYSKSVTSATESKSKVDEMQEQIKLLKEEIEKLREREVEHSAINIKEIDSWLEKDYLNIQI